MNFQMPKKGERAVCHECLRDTPDKYQSCGRPCNHLVSDVVHEATMLISTAISRHKWERETCPGDFSGGD